MPILNKLTGAFPAALIYITLGTLIDVWTTVFLVFNMPETRAGYLWLVGFFLTGLSLLTIGLFLGRIGRAAKVAELPPSEVVAAAVRSEQTAASRVPVIIPVGPAVQGSPAVSSVANEFAGTSAATILKS